MLKTKVNVSAVVISTLLALACHTGAVSSSANSSSDGGGKSETAENSPAAQKEAGALFKGYVATSGVEMILRRENENLNGSYFYVKSGGANSLKLRGKIAANGKFTMQEFDAANKQTGEFQGVWKDDQNNAGVLLEGEWKKTNGKETQYFGVAEQIVLFAGNTQIVNKRVDQSVKVKKFEVTAEYPELTGGANVAGFNQLVKTRVAKRINDSKTEMLPIINDNYKASPDTGSYLNITYDTEYADNDLISVNFMESAFTAGAAHGNYAYFTISYDLRSGKEIKFAELFKPGTKYLNAVSAYATQNLQTRKDPESGDNRGLAQDVFADGAKPTAANYQNWNITKKGLMFTFEPYQVASFADGAQSVIIPFANLKDISNPNGALAKFIK